MEHSLLEYIVIAYEMPLLLYHASDINGSLLLFYWHLWQYFNIKGITILFWDWHLLLIEQWKILIDKVLKGLNIIPFKNNIAVETKPLMDIHRN